MQNDREEKIRNYVIIMWKNCTRCDEIAKKKNNANSI